MNLNCANKYCVVNHLAKQLLEQTSAKGLRIRSTLYFIYFLIKDSSNESVTLSPFNVLKQKLC